MVTTVALPYQIYTLTHSSLAVGFLGAAELVPAIILALLGGGLADAHDRRRLVQLTEAALGLCAVLLALNAYFGWGIWPLYVLAAAMTGLDAMQRPALDSTIPRLVERDEIPTASGLSSLRSTLLMIVGPSLGGIIIAAYGLQITYAFDAVTFGVSLLLLTRLRAVPPTAAEPVDLRRIGEGLRYALGRRDLLGTYLVDWVAMVFGMPNALFPALAATYGGATVLGMFYAAPAVGAAIASATSGWSKKITYHGRAIIFAALIWGVAIAAVGFTHTLFAALAFLAIAGGADLISGIFRQTIWSQSVPDRLRGRVAGIEYISYATGPAVGNVEAGAVATAFSPRISIVSGGVLCVLAVTAVAFALPALWRYQPAAHQPEATTAT
jgi:MFS family permease